MTGTISVMIDGDDQRGRGVFRKLAQTCRVFLAEHAETEALR